MSIILTRLASGGYEITQTGGLTKHISHLGYDSNYNSDRTAIEIFLVNRNGGAESANFAFNDWTINGVSGFLDIEAVAAALDNAGVGFAPPSGGGGSFTAGNGITEDSLNPGTYDAGGPITKIIDYGSASIDTDGTISSVKQSVGPHFTGFVTGDAHPFATIQSNIQGRGVSSKIILGDGSAPGDIEIARLGVNKLGIVIGGVAKWSTDNESILLESGVNISFIDSVTDPPSPTSSILKTYNKGGFLHEIDPSGGVRRLSLNKRVKVQYASQLSSIDATKEYFIDGVVSMNGSTSIDTSNGILINGYGFDVSKIICTDDNYTLFESISSGNIFINNCSIEITGVNSKVFGATANSGFEAVEMDRVNFDNCTDLGYLDGFRQGLETGTGRFGGTPSLDFRGVWLGGYFIQTSIVRNITNSAYSIFKSSLGHSFASRFGGNPNIEIPSNVTAFDFVESDFLTDDLFQLDGANFQGSGTVTTIPISSTKMRISSCKGTENTYVGAYWTITSEVLTTMSPSTLTKVLGTTTFSNLVWFDGLTNNEVTYMSSEKIKVRANFIGSFDSGNNKTFTLTARKYDSVLSSYVDISSTDFTTSGTGRSENVNLTTPLFDISLNDRVEIWISGDGTSGTMLNNSRLIIEEAKS